MRTELTRRRSAGTSKSCRPPSTSEARFTHKGGSTRQARPSAGGPYMPSDLQFWSPRSDSNRRPSDYESDALPLRHSGWWVAETGRREGGVYRRALGWARVFGSGVAGMADEEGSGEGGGANWCSAADGEAVDGDGGAAEGG